LLSSSESPTLPAKSGSGKNPSRLSLIAGILGGLAALAVIIAIVLFLILRASPDEETEEDDVKTTELDEWSDYNPAVLCVTEFVECENILDPEAQLCTFENSVFDETGFPDLLTFGQPRDW
jgi:hypothetical protein